MKHIIKEVLLQEAKKKAGDRCTRIAKRKYDVWPSAYASGAVVRCRQGKIWKNEDLEYDLDTLMENTEYEELIDEKWSKDYKKSINCSNPKGFSQKAHCQGRKKKETKEATGSGSSGAFVGPVFGGDDAFWERSRSENPKLKESEVEKVEAKEATTSGSVGGYESPSMWAKSTKKKDWGPSRKTQIPGGGFVKIKKKCTKFPYCNQGDINNIKISKNESVKEAINNVSRKTGVSKNVIMTILEHEYEKINKRQK